MISIDTSFLVALAVREHPAHRACWKLFQAEMLGRTGAMAIAAQVLTEFCHVVTDNRRFEHPLEMAEALELCEQWWHAQECLPVVADTEVGVLFLTWMHELKQGRHGSLSTSCYSDSVGRTARGLLTTPHAIHSRTRK